MLPLQELQQTLEELIQPIVGIMGVCVRDVDSGQEIGVRLDEPLPLASVCKIPILVTAYRRHDAGSLDLAERVEITEATRCFGSGLFNAFDIGLRPTLHDLLLMMIVVSDNAATDLVLQQLGEGEVLETMRALGLNQIRAERTIARLLGDYFTAFDPGLKDMKFGEWDDYCERIPGLKERGEDCDRIREAVNAAASEQDTSTVRDMARLCAMIAQQKCATPPSCEAMLNILNKQQFNSRLPRHLPPFTKFPHKTGTLGCGAVCNDAGILYLEGKPVAAIAVLSRDVRNPQYETETVLARIGRAVYDFYKSNLSLSPA